MSSPVDGDVDAIVLALTPAGAEAAVRLVDGEAVVLVGPSSIVDAPATVRSGRIFVELAATDTEWNHLALSIARSLVPPGNSLHVVVPGDAPGTTSADVTDVLDGWAVQAVTAAGEVIVAEIGPTDQRIDSGVTAASVEGAIELAQMMGALLEPRSGFADFPYRVSLATSHLRRLPELERELVEIRAQLADERKARPIASRSGPERRGGKLLPSSRATGFSRRMLVAGGGLAACAFGVLIAFVLDADPTVILNVLTAVMVIVLTIDVRRRAIRQHRLTSDLRNVVDRGFARASAASTARSSQLENQMSRALSSLERVAAASDRTLVDTSEMVKHFERVNALLMRLTDESLPRLSSEQSDMRSDLTRELLVLYKQLEAGALLREAISGEFATPPLRGWAASPDLLLLLVEELRTRRPRVVVECGSGASTVWLALAIRALGLDTTVVALEHESGFAAETSRYLELNGLTDIAGVRSARLETISIYGYEGPWYSVEALHDIHDIGLLFVDGPPADTFDGVRYPAMPVLIDRLAEDSTVVLDDTIRSVERDIARRWEAAFPDFALTMKPLEKGAAVLRRVSRSRKGSRGPDDLRSAAFETDEEENGV